MPASYKVPQDVEAEDKLIGPFSFRQFIYLGIVAMALAAAWGLFLLFKPLVVVPLPIVLFFGALALPLRKDQPMETYLAAMVQFYLKPRRRMWMADGIVSRITIDIPQVVERQLIKNLTHDQAISQFDMLSEIADTGGWSTRGVAHAPQAVVDNPGEDMLDNTSMIARNFDTRLQAEDDQRRQDLLARVNSGAIVNQAPAQVSYQQPVQQPVQSYAVPITQPVVVPTVSAQDYVHQYAHDDTGEVVPVYNPAPQYMQQHVVQPLDPSHQMQSNTTQQPASSTTTVYDPEVQAALDAFLAQKENPVTPSVSVATPAIMELAKDVSVETVAKQLHHEQIERVGDEIVINLH